MKALVNKKIKHGKKVYFLKKGEKVGKLPADLKTALIQASYVQRPPIQGNIEGIDSTVTQDMFDIKEHKIEEEQVFENTLRKEDE